MSAAYCRIGAVLVAFFAGLVLGRSPDAPWSVVALLTVAMGAAGLIVSEQE